ncbi:RNA-binding S4 domain-containing protein [Vibrio sp. 404]|uniref:RNA-binding S4 domain-containing protein n=1 Tax=Vibrio marinisediminis TaxID=2758441 RepID=A0A7W2FT67_9VIBR|nr:RNA-binding S4 domain-containing protein [Vibrio marinisediminis]MBA5763811.1 RNA-binding S4 domain-containing protein [Vibrio marinisediminis]
MSDYNQPDDWEDQGEEIEIEAIGIDVSSQPIELYKVFKIANLVSGGGEAKHVISEGYVAVNGELETRKRRKMYDGDFFEFNQEYYVVVCDAPVSEPKEKEVAPSKPEAKPQTKAAKKPSKKEKPAKADKPAKSSKNSAPAKSSKSVEKGKTDNTPKPSKTNGRGSIDFF